jgi:hypothetical protein
MKQGWQLTKKAWGVVRSNPGLTKLPIFGGIYAFFAFLIFGGPGAVLVADDNASTGALVGGGILLAIGIYLASFATIYFGVALAATADAVFRGESADTSAGLAVARSRMGAIASWTVVVTIVSLIVNVIRDRAGFAGQLVAGLGLAIWQLVTFLVIPVLAFEGLGPIAAIKRSAGMFKSKWGEQVTGGVAIGAITGLGILFGIVIAAGGVFVLISGSAAAAVAGAGLLLLGVIIFIGAAVIGAAVRGVFGVALYRYIAEEKVVGPFTVADLESAVKVKGAPAI